jgi:hypothetical protein
LLHIDAYEIARLLRGVQEVTVDTNTNLPSARSAVGTRPWLDTVRNTFLEANEKWRGVRETRHEFLLWAPMAGGPDPASVGAGRGIAYQCASLSVSLPELRLAGPILR